MADPQAPPPNDHFVRMLQFTDTNHRDDYPAVDPRLPQHSQAGRVAIVTGATHGIGRGIAISWAKAGGAGLAIFSRQSEKLEETKQLALKENPDIKIVCVTGDTTVHADVARLEAAVKENFGFAHVVFNNAGMWNARGSIREMDADRWWRDFEVNQKGTYMITQLFLRLLGTEREGHAIQIGTFGCQVVVPDCSSYSVSKTFMNRFTEYIAAENPNVTAICYNPGSVATAILDTNPDFAYFAQDSVELAGNVAIYLASDRAKWLNGRYMNHSWNVEQLEAKKDEILKNNLLKLVINGKLGPKYYEDKN